MARARPFQNPYLLRHIVSPQKKKNILKSEGIEAIGEVKRTLNPETGRARYSKVSAKGGLVLHCVQMVNMLPWWRRVLVPFIGEYCLIGGVKFLKVGQTNIFYRAQEWIAGRARKSSLVVV